MGKVYWTEIVTFILMFQTLVQNIFNHAEYPEFVLKMYTEMCVGHHLDSSIIIHFSNKL